MPRYAVTITIQTERLPDPLPVPAYDPGKDPLHEMVGVLRDAMPSAVGKAFPFRVHQPAGLSMNKAFEIEAESFSALAEILGKFDHLAEEIECSQPGS